MGFNSLVKTQVPRSRRRKPAGVFACALVLLTALFATATSAQTLTATHRYGGPLYEGDSAVTVTITGFNGKITKECSKIGLRFVPGDSTNATASDYTVSGESAGGACDSTRTEAKFEFSFKSDSSPGNKKLVYQLYAVNKVGGAEISLGKFALDIENGDRGTGIILLEKASKSDPRDGLTLQENATSGVVIEVSLKSPPPEGRSVTVDFRNPNVGGAAVRWSGTTPGSNDLTLRTFTKDNYNTPQTITLYPRIDDDSEHWTGTVTAQVEYWYSTHTAHIPVTVTDVTAVPVFAPSRLTLVERGPADSYTVKLDREPVKNVTLVTQKHTHLRFKGPGDSAFGEQATLTFTKGANGTWKTPQTIEVKHIPDSDGSNQTTLPIVHAPGSGTTAWQLSTKDLPVTLTDAGNAPIFSPDSVRVIEGGPAATYTVKLERDPGKTVTLTATVPSEHRSSVKIASTGQAGARANLTFTGGASGTWKTPQTITVTAPSEANLIDETVTLTHSVSPSLDWPGSLNPSVKVQVSDRGGGEVEVLTGGPVWVWEGQEATTYEVKLSHPPTDEATVTLKSSDTTKLVVSPTTLTFTANNYNMAQTVSLTSPAGSVAGDGEGANITHKVTGYGATTDRPDIFAKLVDTTLTETLKLQFSECEDCDDKRRFSGKEPEVRGVDYPAQVEVTLEGPSSSYKGFLPAVSFRVCFQDGEASESRRDIKALPGGKCVDGSLAREIYRASQETTVHVFDLLHDSSDEKFEKLTVTLQEDPDNLLPAMVEIPEAGSKADFIVEDIQLTEVKFERTDSGTIQEGGSDKATFEFATTSRSLYAGEELRVPLKIVGTGITATDYEVTVVEGGTLKTDAPYSASQPALVITGTGKTIHDVSGESQKIVFEVAALADGVAEDGMETMTVGYSAPDSNLNTDGVRFETGATEPASDSENNIPVEIIEHPTVSIVSAGDVVEGADAVFNLTVSPAPGDGQTLTVSYDLAQTGEFVSAAGDVGTGKTISIDDTGTPSITIATVDDSVDEVDGSLTATLATGTGYVIAAAPGNAATVNISDNENTLVILSADANVTEGEKATITATINGLAPAADVVIPITATTGGADGTAETTDYDAPASIILAGEKTGTTEFITHLDADKDDDTVKLALGTLPDGLAAGDPSDVTVTITDDGKGVEATLTSSAASVDNGDPVTITITLDRAFAATTTIPITVAGSGTNPAEATEWEAPASIEVAAGATSATADIATIRDQDTASEEFTVSFGSPLPTNLSTGTPNSATVTINDDGLGHSITFTASPNPVDEDTTTTLTATANGIFDADVTVPLALTNGTAESGDYAIPTTGITIAKGATSGTGTLTTIGDADTDDDTFTVRVDTPRPTGVLASATGYTITIKDTKAFAVVKPKLTVTATPEAARVYDPVSVDEGESVTITAMLDRVHSADIVLPVTMTPGEYSEDDANAAESGDYGSLANITIKAGQTTGTGTVTTNQDAGEDDEYFRISVDLSGLGEAIEYDESFSCYSGLCVFTVEIVDDDKPPPTVWFDDRNFLPESEGHGFQGVVIQAGNPVKSPAPEAPTFNSPPADYDLDVYVDVTQEGRYFKSTSLGRHKLTIPANSSNGETLRLELDDDAIDEPNGSITLTLVENASYKIDPENKTLTSPMADNDETLFTMTASGDDIVEAGGSKPFTITLARALVAGKSCRSIFDSIPETISLLWVQTLPCRTRLHLHPGFPIRTSTEPTHKLPVLPSPAVKMRPSVPPLRLLPNRTRMLNEPGRAGGLMKRSECESRILSANLASAAALTAIRNQTFDFVFSTMTAT